MIVPVTDYKIIQNDVPVLTRNDDGTYISTNCWLSDFNIESENLKSILSGFGFKNNILDTIKQFGHSPKYTPVLRILTNSNVQTPHFQEYQDVLSVALFLDEGNNKPMWLDFFETNNEYRQYSGKIKYKRIGESTLKSLQQEYLHRGITGRSNLYALEFYLKYGFKRLAEHELLLYWGPQR